MTISFTESTVEAAALEGFEQQGYAVLYGPDMAPGEPGEERSKFSDVVLVDRLRSAMYQLNAGIPTSAIEDAIRKVIVPATASLEANNHAFHQMLTDGLTTQSKASDGRIVGHQVQLVDFQEPENNDWLVVNQFTVTEGQYTRRPDIVVFVNGLPLAVTELKKAADENTTIWTAFNQLQTYKKQIPSLFTYNEALVISDGLKARIGSLTAGQERFMPWKTIEGEDLAPPEMPQLQVLIQGVFEKHRFLDRIRHFTVFEEDGPHIVKKMAAYHQFHAVNRAVETTLQAASSNGDRRSGVVWHTQGSGKSLTMAFFAGKIILEPAMANPTIVVITDRNDLDNQLFGVFASCHELLRQKPVQATDRAHLRELLQVASGGVVFTTIQKFMPEEKGDRFPQLSARRNVLVIADEAHRSQYDFIDGFARHLRDALPNASFIGFTGTPIELTDKNTRAVFGDYISIYDIQQAVEDEVTVPIYYEGRLAKIELDEDMKVSIDAEFEEVTEAEEEVTKEKLKSKWAQLEAVVGAEKRVNLIAEDLVTHLKQRLEAMDGKAMVVCMSRRICVELYDAIIKLRPDWHDEDDEKGAIKIVMTGSPSDPLEWQQHIRSKVRRDRLADRFKDPTDPFKIVIVRDMWLTGFDAPCLHTMYLDKPMRGHGLMQAIARVNRVFRDKPGGLIVDYLGLSDQLQRALVTYTESGGKGKTAIDQDAAVAVMLEKYEVCRDMFYGFDYSPYFTGSATQRLEILAAAINHILAQRDDEDGKRRFINAVTALSQAFALAVPHKEALRIRDDVGFLQTVRGGLKDTSPRSGHPGADLDHAIRQIVSKAITPEDQVIDIFAVAGLQKPDISILSDEFLEEVKGLEHRNLAVELLQRLIDDEVKAQTRRNVVQARSFAEMLDRALKAYQNRTIETAQVIEQLIELAKQIREAQSRGEKLGLSEAELAFYDALGVNDSAVQVLGDQTLREIAQELAVTVRQNASIDWTLKESARARMRVLVRRLLRRYNYPPDKQEEATQTVIQQAENLGAEWAA
jgi:type I restriction enzyme R subunit